MCFFLVLIIIFLYIKILKQIFSDQISVAKTLNKYGFVVISQKKPFTFVTAFQTNSKKKEIFFITKKVSNCFHNLWAHKKEKCLMVFGFT